MFAPSRFLRNFSSISPEVVTRIANKAMAAPNAFPAAKPIPFGLRAKDGSYVPVKDFQDYIKIVSEHPDFKDKVFAGAGMKHIDTKRFNSLTLRYVAVAFALSIAGALAYKIHNNAYMRDVRADFPKFQYLHERANEAVAKMKAAELAAKFAAEDAAEAEAESE